MANILFANNASSLLAATIVPADLTIQVKPGFGALFPSPSAPQICYITLEDDTGAIEVMKCTSRSVDLLTVVRGQDGTVALDFILDVTRVELRVQAVVLEEFLQANGDAMTGDLDFATNEIQNAYLTGTTRITGGQTIGTAIRGTLDQSNNELVVPAASGVRATAGGVPIVVNTDDLIALLDTAGVIEFDSATVGIRIPAGAYLRIQDSDDDAWLQGQHDGTDFNLSFIGTGLLKITGVDIDLGAGVDLIFLDGSLSLADGQLDQPLLNDFAVQRQAVSAAASTTVDYELGQYVELALGVNIDVFAIDNPPITARYGAVRLRVTQGSGGQTINWPAAYKWGGAVEPVLSTGTGEVDFIDLWTSDAGATWYGTSGEGFA